MILKICAILVLSTLIAATVSADDYQKFAEKLQALAYKGDEDAEVQLAHLYYLGQGVFQDVPRARKMLFDLFLNKQNKEAAAAAAMIDECSQVYVQGEPTKTINEWANEIGLPIAQTCLGITLIYKTNDDKSHADGIMLLRRAAAKNYPIAITALAQLYRDGRFLPSNEQLAKTFLVQAAELGVTDAQLELGMMGLKNEELSPWLERAAEQGHPKAQHIIGGVYGFGLWRTKKMRSVGMDWLYKSEQTYSRLGQRQEALKVYDTMLEVAGEDHFLSRRALLELYPEEGRTK